MLNKKPPLNSLECSLAPLHSQYQALGCTQHQCIVLGVQSSSILLVSLGFQWFTIQQLKITLLSYFVRRFFAIAKILSPSLSLPIVRDSLCQDSGKDLSSSPEVISWILALVMAEDKHSISKVFILLPTVSCLFTVELEVLLDSLQMSGRRTLLVLK